MADRCRLVVVGIESGGRWSPEAVEFVDMLAGARAREAPLVLRRSAFLVWRGRWRRMLAVCSSFANSMVSRSSDTVGKSDDKRNFCVCPCRKSAPLSPGAVGQFLCECYAEDSAMGGHWLMTLLEK